MTQKSTTVEVLDQAVIPMFSFVAGMIVVSVAGGAHLLKDSELVEQWKQQRNEPANSAEHPLSSLPSRSELATDGTEPAEPGDNSPLPSFLTSLSNSPKWLLFATLYYAFYYQMCVSMLFLSSLLDKSTGIGHNCSMVNASISVAAIGAKFSQYGFYVMGLYDVFGTSTDALISGNAVYVLGGMIVWAFLSVTGANIGLRVTSTHPKIQTTGNTYHACIYQQDQNNYIISLSVLNFLVFDTLIRGWIAVKFILGLWQLAPMDHDARQAAFWGAVCTFTSLGSTYVASVFVVLGPNNFVGNAASLMDMTINLILMSLMIKYYRTPEAKKVQEILLIGPEESVAEDAQ